MQDMTWHDKARSQQTQKCLGLLNISSWIPFSLISLKYYFSDLPEILFLWYPLNIISLFSDLPEDFR